MASKGKGGKDKGGPKAPTDEPPKTVSAMAFPESRIIKDETPFPAPEIYFKVFDSELDEPDAKVRRDVGKLYERWQEKYGRRWPEHGMGTEDLVWLAEEAYKEPGQGGIVAAKTPGVTAIEEEMYPGEFIPEPDEGAGTGAKKRVMSNYDATVAGARWVTDEFESQDYEAGNLETLWGTHLWDYEGKPLYMPRERADAAKVRMR